MSGHTSVEVAEKRTCDFCVQRKGLESWAYADAKIPGGGWANVCSSHFLLYGCSLGLGKGQEYIVKERP